MKSGVRKGSKEKKRKREQNLNLFLKKANWRDEG